MGELGLGVLIPEFRCCSVRLVGFICGTNSSFYEIEGSQTRLFSTG